METLTAELPADVEALRELCLAQREQLRRLERDALTGLLRREPWHDRAEAWLADPETGPWALAFLDLDGFKPVNDRLGHAAGDELLRAIGGRLSAWAERAGALVGRLGGDEFAALWPSAGPEAARVGAAEVARRIAVPVLLTGDGLPPAVRGAQVRVTASVGVVRQADHPDAGLGELLGLADAAMYRAKEAGEAGAPGPRVWLADPDVAAWRERAACQRPAGERRAGRPYPAPTTPPE